jgi:hypothetical protein
VAAPAGALAQLTLAAGDGIAVQPGNPRQRRKAAVPLLAGEETEQEPSGAFVHRSHKTVEGAVFPSNLAVGMLSADRASARVDMGSILLCHATYLPRRCHQKG